MARLTPKVRVEYTISIEINEDEAGALDALAGYGSEAFLKVFYEKLGKAYLQPHEKGLMSLFEKIRGELPSQLTFVRSSKKIISDALKQSAS